MSYLTWFDRTTVATIPGVMPTPSPTHAGDPALMALGAAIRSARKARGVSQEALADASVVERAYMSAIERGLQNVSLMTLMRVAKALDLTLAQLLGRAGI